MHPQNRKGNVALVGMAVAVGLAVVIGAYITGTFQNSLLATTVTLPNASQTAINGTFTNVYSAFSLGGVMPLVLFAAGIIGAVGAFAVMRR